MLRATRRILGVSIPNPRSATLSERCLAVEATAKHPALHLRAFSNPASSPSDCAVYQVWGANTEVGKTVLSAGLLRAASTHSCYIKPVQSGYPADDDAKIITKNAEQVHISTLFTYNLPLSPDQAARVAGLHATSDDSVLQSTSNALEHFITSFAARAEQTSVALIETAGGVLSPAPSGSTQADLYRPLRVPALLVGDSRLGGISTTLAAYEALTVRGYDVPSVVLFAHPDPHIQNELSLQNHVSQRNTSVFLAPSLPPSSVPLSQYFMQEDTALFFGNLLSHILCAHSHRFQVLAHMAERAPQVFWYPFTQHASLPKVTTFDSAFGDSFIAYDQDRGLYPLVDGFGSWWTNTVGHGNPRLAKAIAAAAGRYGHIMFAEAASMPSFNLSERLLEGPGKGWASRVFFSDDGSTAVEVALKMAFRKRARDCPERAGLPVKIVSLRNSYHGDTLGVMNCSEESDFNKLQTPWYKASGVFLDPPTVALRDGVWTVTVPADFATCGDRQDGGSATSERRPNTMHYQNLDDVFSQDRDFTDYTMKITAIIDEELTRGVDLGALVLEPVLQGAGGMYMIDPAFQRAMVSVCRERAIPVVFDEVFTGFWRLGRETAAEMLGCKPDIATYAKLLTGGTVPLSVTLAREEVLRAFDGDTKLQALLHGHSYTAHPIGCAAAVETLQMFDEKFSQQDVTRKDFWSEELAREMSSYEAVGRVVSIGTVLAVELTSSESGYAARGARDVAAKLNRKGIFARPLGNVIYLVCTPFTEEHVCDSFMKTFSLAIEEGRNERALPTRVSKGNSI